jgi:hypothetical protein
LVTLLRIAGCHVGGVLLAAGLGQRRKPHVVAD